MVKAGKKGGKRPAESAKETAPVAKRPKLPVAVANAPLSLAATATVQMSKSKKQRLNKKKKRNNAQGVKNKKMESSSEEIGDLDEASQESIYGSDHEHTPHELEDDVQALEKKPKKKVNAKKGAVMQKKEEEEKEESEDESGDDEEVSDEDSDEDEEGSDDGDMFKETGEKMNFDVQAFPMEAEDKDGVVNMLTQVFLRAKDIDIGGMADSFIAAAPVGCVFGPEEADDDDNTTSNVVYALMSFVAMDKSKKWSTDLQEFLPARARNTATKEMASRCTSFLSEDSIAMFVNERMLNFPSVIAPPAAKSLLDDLKKMKNPPKKIVYIQKLRVVEDANEKKDTPAPAQEGGKKAKMGKAAKKRAAAAALAEALVEFESEEDAMLAHLPTGELFSFDYPVHMDADVGSKFHIQKKGSISRIPYRRATFMDTARFRAFLAAIAQS